MRWKKKRGSQDSRRYKKRSRSERPGRKAPAAIYALCIQVLECSTSAKVKLQVELIQCSFRLLSHALTLKCW